MFATVSPLMRIKSERMTCLWSISRSASPALMQLVLTMVWTTKPAVLLHALFSMYCVS